MGITVVVPTYNEEDNIGRLLSLLQLQTVIPDEVIVFDDGSTDKTVEIARSYGVKVVEGAHEGVNNARHQGTLMAKTDIVLQTDADCVPPETWIERITEKFDEDEDLIGLTGPVYDRKKRFLESITSIAANKIFHGVGCNTAFKKEAYLKTEGYSNAIAMNQGGDVVLWKKLKKIGECRFSPDIKVGHSAGYKWRGVGAAIVVGSFITAGMVTTHFWRKDVGIGLIGIGSGFAVTEIGARIIPLKRDTPDWEYAVNATNVHHDVWGVLYTLAVVALDRFGYIKNRELLAGLYGASLSVLLHHILTEPDGCFEGLCLWHQKT